MRKEKGPRKTHWASILSLICGVLLAPLGIIFGENKGVASSFLTE